ncbi:unnamed protein product, partial [Toxocara canis]|uniref:Hyp20 n=1 Tax=Toxocara canis TaxID=6265 RepID=A0A183U8G1_TOXCA
CEPYKIKERFRFDDINPNTNAPDPDPESGNRVSGMNTELDAVVASKRLGRISNRNDVTNNDNGNGNKLTITKRYVFVPYQ